MKKISKILATILAVALIVTAFPISSFALGTQMETAQEIKFGETVEISIFENGGDKWLSFVPETDGYYAFYSFNNDFDTEAYVYDSEGAEIGYDDDSAGELNFKIVLELNAGETYYLNAMPLADYESGKYSVSVKQAEKAQSVSINKSKDIVIYTGVMYSLTPEFLPVDSVREAFETVTNDENMIFLWDSDTDIPFTANYEGTATITVTTENGLTDTVNITAVDPEEISLDQVKDFKIDATEISHCYSFIPAEDATYKISVKDANEDCCSFTDVWENEEQIAYESGFDYYFTVDLKAGQEYKINTKNNDGIYETQASMSLVIEKAILPTSITINAPTEKIYMYQEFELDCTVEPANANVLNLEWYIEDYDIIQPNAGDRFYPIKIGTATITVVAGEGVSDSIEIEVLPYEPLSLNQTQSFTLDNEKSEKYFSFTPTLSSDYCFDFAADDYFDNYYAIYNSEREEITCSYNCTDKIYVYLEAGETYTIYADNYSDEERTVELTVTKAVMPESFTILLSERIEGYVGKYISMETSLTPEGCSQIIHWTSSDEEVAYVYQNGDVSIEGVGTAIITGTTSNGLTDSFVVVGLKKPVIELDKEYEVEIDKEYGVVSYEFTPEKTGYYSFSFDSVDMVYTSIESEYEGHIDGFNDSFNCYFEEGTTYQIQMQMNYVPTGSFSFVVGECVGVKSVEILTLPTRLTYIEDFGGFDYSGLTVKVTLDNGETAIYNYDTDDTVLGYGVRFVDCYNEAGTYSHTIVLLGDVFDKFEFIIKENTVESIELVSEPLELMENNGGYFAQDYNGNSFYYYNYSLNDIVVKINYTDSTSVIASLGTIVDGYMVDWFDNQFEQPWAVGGENNYIEVSYLGATVLVPVNIVESPVEKIVLNSAPSRVYYKHDADFGWTYADGTYDLFAYDYTGLSFTVYFKDGTYKTYTDADIGEFDRIDGYNFEINYDWMAETGEVEVTAFYMGTEFTYYLEYKEFPVEVKDITVIKLPDRVDYEQHYYPDFIGTVIEITYGDGTTKRVEVTNDNVEYETDVRTAGIITKVYVDGFALLIQESYNPENPFAIVYGGITKEFSGINYTPSKEVKSLTTKGGVSDLQIIVNYFDGTSEAFDFKGVIDLNRDVTLMTGFITTSKGLIPYHILVSDNGNDIKIYEIYFFDDYVELEVETALSGDVNGDGNVNVADVAQFKKLLAGLLSETEAAGLNSDIDGNAITNVADLAQLKKIVAGLI